MAGSVITIGIGSMPWACSRNSLASSWPSSGSKKLTLSLRLAREESPGDGSSAAPTATMAGGAVADAEAGAGDGACAFAAVAMSAATSVATSAARIGGSRGSFIVAVTTAARRTALDTERYQHRRTRRFTILDGLGGALRYSRRESRPAGRTPRFAPDDDARDWRNDDANPNMDHRLAAAAAGDGAARVVHALPGNRQPLPQRLLDPEGRAAGVVHRARQLPQPRRRPDLLAGASQQPHLRGRHDPAVDRAGAADGRLGQRPHRRQGLPAARLFHADDPADDRGRQHLALLLHAGVRPHRAGEPEPGIPEPQLARQPEHGTPLRDDRRRVERGGILHDLLPRRAAVDVAQPRRGR